MYRLQIKIYICDLLSFYRLFRLVGEKVFLQARCFSLKFSVV